MNWQILIIDALGASFEVYLIMLLYGTFFTTRVCKKCVHSIGFLLYIFLNLVLIGLFQNQVWLPIFGTLPVIMLGFYFEARFTSRMLVAVLFTAITAISEVSMAVLTTRFSGVSIETVQSSFALYAVGVFSSKLLTLILIYIIRFFIAPKKQEFGSKWFNLVMLVLPLQSLLLCLVVSSMIINVGDPIIRFLYEIILLSSLILLGVAAFIMRNQLKAMQYKQEYERAQSLLQAQIEHYNELYLAGQEIKAMRHSMKNEYIALSGLLSENKVSEALRIISDSESRIESIGSIVDTGYSAVDEVVGSKIKKATENNTVIGYKMLIDSELLVDQFDIAVILANALDNAIEAVVKGADTEKTISAVITGKGNYISIKVENHTSETVDMELETTKDDKGNHGFGIRQMRIIAEKYDGNLSAKFDAEKMMFSLNVLLKNRKPG